MRRDKAHLVPDGAEPDVRWRQTSRALWVEMIVIGIPILFFFFV